LSNLIPSRGNPPGGPGRRRLWGRTPTLGGSLLLTIAMLAGLVATYAGVTSAAPITPVQIATAVTAPQPGVILSGSAINPATGAPYRHLWYGDFANGLCRLDPDLDTNVPASQRSLNINTCIHFVANFVQFKPGQIAFDPATNDLYTVDIQAKSDGIIRMHFNPSGGTSAADAGHGIVDPVNSEVLGGFGNGCGVAGNVPNSAALGPDGNLYIGFKRAGNILRFVAPQTEPFPCTNVQTIGTTADGRKDFGLGWVGHDLYGGDGNTPWVIHNADGCFTPANNFTPCQGLSVLGGVVAVPTVAMSDQTYSGSPVCPTCAVPHSGTTMYFADGVSNVAKVQFSPSQVVNSTYATGFQKPSGLAIDARNTANEIVYVGDDGSGGLLAGQGNWWSLSNAPLAPAVPPAPTGVTATAGNNQATVNWTDGGSGSQPTTSYTILTFAADGTRTADPAVVVTAPAGSTTLPTTGTVLGLVNGANYKFAVTATNSVGTSAASAFSNIVSPHPNTVPAAPTGVSASAGNASAQVAWTASASNGGSPITGYTVTSTPGAIQVSVPATATGVTVTGLTNNTSYTFTVHATNGVGNSLESAPSNAVTPNLSAGAPDISVSMTGPATISPGANATYRMTVSNLGPTNAAQVLLSDVLPAGTTLVAASPVTTTQGSCALGSTISCNLGAMAAPGPTTPTTATVSVTVNIPTTLVGSVTNNASVQLKDAAGNLLTDPNTANNSASFTTTIGSSAPPVTTDIQLSGSAQNGGPAVGSSDTYTFQVKNAQTPTASGVVFTDTLPSTLKFVSASSNLGTCTGPASGSLGGTVTCSADSLANGQQEVITISVIVPTAGSIANTGSVTFNGTDSNPANNSVTVTIQAK
jgi:uncharacterized repeat protein (TIGR01451 family)